MNRQPPQHPSVGLARLRRAATFRTFGHPLIIALGSLYGLGIRSSSFTYRPLDASDHQIRLIKIRSQDQLDGNIYRVLKATIEHVSLKANPSCLALSYAWGDQARTKPLLLDGHVLQITENLDQAIRHLLSVDDTPLRIPDRPLQDARRPTSPGRKILHLRDYIWVDVICINQQDNVEKSWQVQLMRNIFERASAVIIWLGPTGDGSDTVMKCFQEVGEGFCNSPSENTI
jgi:hypothetical protein